MQFFEGPGCWRTGPCVCLASPLAGPPLGQTWACPHSPELWHSCSQGVAPWPSLLLLALVVTLVSTTFIWVEPLREERMGQEIKSGRGKC